MNTVAFTPAYPSPGHPGESFGNPRVSIRWPGGYIGRCFHCQAHILADKRALRCDVCENRRIEAILECQITLNHDTAKPKTTQQKLREAFEGLLARYVQLAGSGDCGWWDPETEEEVIAARLALKEMAG